MLSIARILRLDRLLPYLTLNDLILSRAALPARISHRGAAAKFHKLYRRGSLVARARGPTKFRRLYLQFGSLPDEMEATSVMRHHPAASQLRRVTIQAAFLSKQTRNELVRFLRASLISFALLASALAGCRHEDDIQRETITYDDREPIHLRVVILHDGKFAWFFRVDGPASQVKEHLPAFDRFVRSVEFTGRNDKPIKWTEPKQWKKDPPMPERYASFRIASEPKVLEVKVTKLPVEGYSLMANMHRWQKQVNLPLSENADDNEQYFTREEINGRQATWVNMIGLGVHTVSKPADPKAGDQKQFLPGMHVEKTGKFPFKSTAPANWAKKENPGAMAAEAYQVDKTLEVTLTLAGGDPADNVNRWRKQVDLPPLPPQELAATVKDMVVAGKEAYYVDLANPAKNRTLGVILPMNPKSSWFVKMTGPHDLVGQHKTEFEAFVQSFKK
jgi:hypothetical protein